MRAMVIDEAGGELRLERRDIPEPGEGEVLVKVHSCGVCGGDAVTMEGEFPGIPYPIVPGHEIAGEIARLGEHVRGRWKVGARVGVGWFGGNCGWCDPCRRGRLMHCENMGIPGVSTDGGYAEYVVVPETALARMPDELEPPGAAPMMCAGSTVFEALRASGAPPGARVAVLGIGGLGHLAVQFAARLGHDTVAISRGSEKADLAHELGADHFIDSGDGDPAAALLALGGADVLLATAPSTAAMGALFGGLLPDGRLMAIGAADSPVPAPVAALINGDKAIVGHNASTAIGSEDTLDFCVHQGVEAMIETMPLERAPEAYARMRSGEARFRMVLQVAD